MRIEVSGEGFRISDGGEEKIFLLPIFPRAEVIDLATGQKIPYCFLADETTGEYGQYVFENGDYVLDETGGHVKRHYGTAKLKINFLSMPDEALEADTPHIIE